MRRGTLVLTAVLFIGVLAASTLIPSIQADTGKWRNINPTEYTSVPDARLNSIYVLNGGTGGIGSGKAWAVGNNGTIFNWDGFSWLNQSSGTPCTLNSVNFGGSGIGSSSFPSVPLTPFDSRAGFIVGGNTSLTVCPGQFAMFWNGFGWFPVTTGLDTSTGNLTSVFVTAVSNPGSSNPTVEAWAAGINATAGTTYHFFGNPAAGGGWNKVFVVDGSSTGCEIDSIFMASTIEGWAAGKCGMIWHYVGGSWILGPGVPALGFDVPGFPGVKINFKSIFMDSTTDGWAVGSNAQTAHFTGGIWTCCVTPGGVVGSPTLSSLSMVSSSEAWVVGDGATIVHGTGLTSTPNWSGLAANQIPTLDGLRGIHATGGSNVWAVGDTGSILMYDGSIWGSITAPLQTNFNAVYMTGSSDGIAVGNTTSSGPTIARWDGVKWSRPQGTLSSTDLWGTWEANSGDWWVVGGGEGFYPYTAHMSGGTLATVTPPTCQNGVTNCVLLSVYGTSSSNVWAVGTGGIAAQWTCPGGTCSWGASSPPVTVGVQAQTTWRSVTFVGGDQNKGWVVGFNPTGPLIDCYVNACTMLGAVAGAGWATSGGLALSTLPAGTQLNSVQTQLDNSNLVWIAGSNGVILLINGNTQTITKVPTTFTYNLTSISVVSSSDGWAVGQDTTTNSPVFVHYDGTGWSPVDTIPAFTNLGRLNGMFLLSSTDGFAVGTTTTANPLTQTATLGMMFHLDPPGGVIATTSNTILGSTSTTSAVTSSSSVGSTTSQVSSVTTASAATTTEISMSVSTSLVSTTAVVTQTVATSSSATTPLVLPAIPGFPWESIIAGIVIGIALLGIIRRHRRKAG